VGGLGKNPFHGGGMDILWNYTLGQSFFFNKATSYKPEHLGLLTDCKVYL